MRDLLYLNYITIHTFSGVIDCQIGYRIIKGSVLGTPSSFLDGLDEVRVDFLGSKLCAVRDFQRRCIIHVASNGCGSYISSVFDFKVSGRWIDR